VYVDTQADCLLHDEPWERTITVAKTHSHSTVVWNPWINKSAKMADFGDNEWPGMVCIETANVGPHAIKLSPGESHTMTATISL
jgi:glucose-6-phosphate 1-epimerase